MKGGIGLKSLSNVFVFSFMMGMGMYQAPAGPVNGGFPLAGSTHKRCKPQQLPNTKPTQKQKQNQKQKQKQNTKTAEPLSSIYQASIAHLSNIYRISV